MVLASGRDGQVEALLEAALVEIPLAIFLVWLARHYEHTVAAVMAALRRRLDRARFSRVQPAAEDRRLWQLPLEPECGDARPR